MSANTDKDPYFCEDCGQVVRFVQDRNTKRVGIQCACPTSVDVRVARKTPEEWDV